MKRRLVYSLLIALWIGATVLAVAYFDVHPLAVPNPLYISPTPAPTATPLLPTLAPIEPGSILLWYKSCTGRIEVQPDILGTNQRVFVRCIGTADAPDEDGGGAY